MPKVIKGNVLEVDADVRLFTGNGVVTRKGLVMGAGNAKAFAERYPELPKILGHRLGIGVHRYGLLLQGNIGAFQTKLDWRNPSSYELIEFSVQQLSLWLENHPELSVALPFPGIGLGGLNPELVLRILEPLPERVLVCHL